MSSCSSPPNADPHQAAGSQPCYTPVRSAAILEPETAMLRSFFAWGRQQLLADYRARYHVTPAEALRRYFGLNRSRHDRHGHPTSGTTAAAQPSTAADCPAGASIAASQPRPQMPHADAQRCGLTMAGWDADCSSPMLAGDNLPDPSSSAPNAQHGASQPHADDLNLSPSQRAEIPAGAQPQAELSAVQAASSVPLDPVPNGPSVETAEPDPASNGPPQSTPSSLHDAGPCLSRKRLHLKGSDSGPSPSKWAARADSARPGSHAAVHALGSGHQLPAAPGCKLPGSLPPTDMQATLKVVERRADHAQAVHDPMEPDPPSHAVLSQHNAEEPCRSASSHDPVAAAPGAVLTASWATLPQSLQHIRACWRHSSVCSYCIADFRLPSITTVPFSDRVHNIGCHAMRMQQFNHPYVASHAVSCQVHATFWSIRGGVIIS